jgi:hypothetical protein
VREDFLQKSGPGNVDRLQFRPQYEVTFMKHIIIAMGVVAYYLQASLPFASAQAFGEYGRTLGGAIQRGGSSASNATSGRDPKRKLKNGYQGVGDLGVQPLQKRLIVAEKGAPLYPSQDDETQKIDELSQGAILIPMIHATSGANSWYMVKTQKGSIGWVRSTDVVEQSAKR